MAKVMLTRGCSAEKCRKVAKTETDGILKRTSSAHWNENRLTNIERAYYAYRIGNPKVIKPLETGVLGDLCGKLTKIVRKQSVPDTNKEQALNLLAGFTATHALRQLVSDDNLEYKFKEQILDIFPTDNDHHFLNIAFDLSLSNRDTELVKKAINKLKSPKSLLTLCISLQNVDSTTKYRTQAIERIYEVAEEAIDEAIAKGEIEDKAQFMSQCLERDITDESLWTKPHALKMYYSSQIALQKICLTFANYNKNNPADNDRELELIKLALKRIKLPAVLDKLMIYTDRRDKRALFMERLKGLKIELKKDLGGEYPGKDYSDRYYIMSNALYGDPAAQVEAIKQLDCNNPEEKKVYDELVNKKDSLHEDVRRALCMIENDGKHDFDFVKEEAANVCRFCGLKEAIPFMPPAN